MSIGDMLLHNRPAYDLVLFEGRLAKAREDVAFLIAAIDSMSEYRAIADVSGYLGRSKHFPIPFSGQLDQRSRAC